MYGNYWTEKLLPRLSSILKNNKIKKVDLWKHKYLSVLK
jgi:hypothetical protein